MSLPHDRHLAELTRVPSARAKYVGENVKVAHTRLPSVGFRS